MAISTNMTVVKYKIKVREASNGPHRVVKIERHEGTVGAKRGPLCNLQKCQKTYSLAKADTKILDLGYKDP